MYRYVLKRVPEFGKIRGYRLETISGDVLVECAEIDVVVSVLEERNVPPDIWIVDNTGYGRNQPVAQFLENLNQLSD